MEKQLYIIDPITKNRTVIEDLEKAINQAEEFASYQQISKYSKERNIYWNNVLTQLLKLKNEN